jgi:hypothetical protein
MLAKSCELHNCLTAARLVVNSFTASSGNTGKSPPAGHATEEGKTHATRLKEQAGKHEAIISADIPRTPQFTTDQKVV